MAPMTYCMSLVTITVSSGRRSRKGTFSSALLAISGTMVTASSIDSESCVSMLKVRMVSISSSKKSRR